MFDFPLQPKSETAYRDRRASQADRDADGTKDDAQEPQEYADNRVVGRLNAAAAFELASCALWCTLGHGSGDRKKAERGNHGERLELHVCLVCVERLGVLFD